jgi:hypothetical protein
MDPHPKSISDFFFYCFRGCSVSHTCAAASQGHTERNQKKKVEKIRREFQVAYDDGQGGDIGLDPWCFSY